MIENKAYELNKKKYNMKRKQILSFQKARKGKQKQEKQEV